MSQFDPLDSATDTDTKYRFFPVVRRGYPPDEYYHPTAPTEGEDRTSVATAGEITASFDVTASGNGSESDSGSVSIDMYGPEHVAGVDGRQVVRMEPEPGTSNYPPNYFATVEFDAPDLPWLFSPVAADTQTDSQPPAYDGPHGRGLPWLCLVVVEKSGKTGIDPAGTNPLPSLTAPVPELPPLDETWAWAHAQVVGSPKAKDDTPTEESTRDFGTTFRSESNLTRSRLISPRNLQPNKRYIAAVVPVFEAGRAVGLGEEATPGETSMAFAWDPSKTSARDGGDGGDTVTLPVYHHWEFSTGRTGDFEYLARQLEPRDLNDGSAYDIGFRELNVSDPGPAVLERWGPPQSERTARMGGALKQVGSSIGSYSAAADLADVLNEPEQLQELTDEDLKVVGPPIYGGRHAQTSRIEDPPDTGDEWLAELNTHPGHRMAAAVGSEIVRDKQEQLMDSAWDQVGEIRAANRQLRAAQLSRAAMDPATRAIDATSDAWMTQFTAAAHDRVLRKRPDGSTGVTLGSHLDESWAPRGLASPAFRRLTSDAGRLAGRLDSCLDSAALLRQVATGRMSVTSIDSAPDGTVRLDPEVDLRERCEAWLQERDSWEKPESLTPRSDSVTWLRELLSSMESEAEDCLRLLTVLAGKLAAQKSETEASDSEASESGGSSAEESRLEDRSVLALVERVAKCSSAVAGPLDELAEAMEMVAFEEADQGLPTVDDDYTVRRSQKLFERIAGLAGGSLLEPGEDDRVGRDDVDEARSRLVQLLAAIADVRSYLNTAGGSDDEYQAELYCEPSPEDTEAPAPDLGAAGRSTNPERALVDRVGHRLGGLDLTARPDPLDRVMAYPSFPDPMYRDLKDVSEAYLLPGVEEIPTNTFGALQTNPAFIESFMVGLNHEMADELLWRGFPTDRRGSHFRQFWDPSARVPKPSDPDDLKDVTELHTWDDDGVSELGSNVMTGAGSGNSGSDDGDTSNVVVVIRGELLRRYPQTTIYATKAKRVETADGSGYRRVPEWPSPAEKESEVDDQHHRFPIFRGEIDPDVNFLGFDLEPDEATGAEPTATLGDSSDSWVTDGKDSLGWFFVMEEPPGEVRFGIDVNQGDVGTRPNGMTYTEDGSTGLAQTDDPDESPEYGWSGLSWGHLVEPGTDPASVDNVSVYGARPWTESWETQAGDDWVDSQSGESRPPITAEEVADWGKNSAHMAYITWQRPVRIAIHADDMLPETPSTNGDSN